jgi:hypothetical protein
MQPEIQISLVIPAGSGVGPFDLYSNVDGYTTPFETGVDAALLTGSGYITTPPDGTTFIRVQSTGSCLLQQVQAPLLVQQLLLVPL